MISTTTVGANIRYTLDGSSPSSTSGIRIASNHGTISVTPTTDGTTLRAIAYAPGISDSDVNEASYYYLGGNGADTDPSAVALLPGELGGPPAGGASESVSVVPNYDHNGNLIHYKGWSYSYDAQNRLTSASNGTHTALFHYDGKNRQIMRSMDGAVRFSVWDDWELLEEYDTSNVRQAAYLQGAQGVVKSLVNNIYYYQDKLGSTTHIADARGNLLESYRYDLYGTPSYFDQDGQLRASQVSGYGVNDLYAGERWIGELGLYDLRNRFMSPELGRFLQTDPVGFKGDASNLYRYCHNDPEDFSDPTGLDDKNYVPDWDTLNHALVDLTKLSDSRIYVGAHGSPTFIANSNMTRRYWNALQSNSIRVLPEHMQLSVKQLVNDVKALDKYRPTIPIQLNICHAGDVKAAAQYQVPTQAQQVANGLGTNPVIANAGDVNPWDNKGTGDWYRFSKDKAPVQIAGKGAAPDDRTLTAADRRAFDQYGSTTAAAAAWQSSWGNGGWLGLERTLTR
jgi:RHS repeat-associated protein